MIGFGSPNRLQTLPTSRQITIFVWGWAISKIIKQARKAIEEMLQFLQFVWRALHRWMTVYQIIIKMRKKTTSEIICQNFKIPHETIFQDYKCTYKSSITFFGRLYIGEEHFLFNSNMFGIVKKCTIDVNTISKIQESPDSSTITVVEKQDSGEVEFTFGNFKHNKAYKLMRAIWTGEKIGKDAFKPDVDDDVEEFNKSQEVDPSLLIDEGQVEANFFQQQTVESQKQKIVDLVLPCTVPQFYDFFISDKASVYHRRKHLELRKSREIKITEWRKSEELESEVREVSAIIKVKGVPFKTEATMNSVWMLKWKGEDIHINIVTQISDVPYAAYFNCQQHITITKQGEKKCKMNVLASVVFSKSTYMKNTIISRTFGDLKEEYEFWIKNTNTFLDQIRKKKESNNEADKKGVDIEYEESKIISDKSLPSPPFNPVPSPVHVVSLFTRLSLEQKVNIILVIAVFILVINVAQLLSNATK